MYLSAQMLIDNQIVHEQKTQGVQLIGVANQTIWSLIISFFMDSLRFKLNNKFFYGFIALTSHLDAYISRSGDFCADR